MKNLMTPLFLANIFAEWIDRFTEYVQARSIVIVLIDLLLVVALFAGLVFILIRYLDKKFVLYTLIGLAAIYMITFILDLRMFKFILPIATFLYVIAAIIYYIPNIRQVIEGVVKHRNSKSFLTNEESREELISTLLRTTEHLASRKIGAIITIEKEDSLTAYFAKGTMLESVISYELLCTIFMPGTALHDGAVVIRGDKVMCAGVFYQPSDRNDLEKRLGSRHRAALGIAEDSDSFTIVVSEERGSIAVAVNSQLMTGVTLDGLRTFLKQNIIIK